MYSVWQEKEKLQREVANLELQLKLKTQIAELDKQINLQVSCLFLLFLLCMQNNTSMKISPST